MTAPTSAQLADRIFQLLPRITYRKASTQAEKAEVYSLRYHSYLREGAILPDAEQRLTDRFDHSPNGQIICISLNGKLCGSVRIHVVSYRGDAQSPATHAFPDILSKAVDKGEVIVDPSRLVVDQESSRANPDLIYAVLRVPFIAALHFGADQVTATVRPEHQAFYRRVLRFEVASPARPYPTLLTPLSLMTVRLGDSLGEVQRRYPFFQPFPGEETALFGSADTGCRARAVASFSNPDNPGKEVTM